MEDQQIPTPYTFKENLRLAYGFRSFFIPFLLPAAGLLIFAFIQSDLTLSSTIQGQRVIDSFMTHQAPSVSGASMTLSLLGSALNSSSPLVSATWMAAFLLGAAGLGVLAEQARLLLTQKFRLRIQADVIQALVFEPGQSRSGRQSGAMSNIFMGDASGLSALLIFGLLGLVENGVRLGTYTIGLLRIPDAWKAFVVLIPLGIVFQALIARLFTGAEKRANEHNQLLNALLYSRIVRFFELVGRLVYFHGDRTQSRALIQLSRDAGEANRKYHLVVSVRDAVSGIVTSLSLPIIVIVLQGTARVPADLSPGTVVQTQSLIGLLLMTISSFISFPLMVAQYSPSMRRVRELLDIPKPNEQPKELTILVNRSGPAAIELKELGFHYAGSTKPVLRGLTIEIPAGAVVGITGKSGCGKSTLGKLLIGELMPTQGKILLEQTDITNWHLIWKRHLVGFLPTGFEFLDDTLEENILLGRDRSEIRDFERALRLSGVEELMRTEAIDLKYKIRSLSGEGFLSFGQRRRVGIAQLLCGDQRVFVFDEPGSSLDPQTMLNIAENLREAVKGRTALIITHDPDVFKTDFNIFLQNGLVADIGPHQRLMDVNQDYFDLLNKTIDERRARVCANSAG